MANQEHLDILRQGVEVWNKWREKHPEIIPDLSKADLSPSSHELNRNLIKSFFWEEVAAFVREYDVTAIDPWGEKITLSNVNLNQANLDQADLEGVDLSMSDLREMDAFRVNFRGAVLKGANISGAYLNGSDFTEADLEGADLSGANLEEVILVRTNLERANLMGCSIHGISAWNIKLEGAIQNDLVITPDDEPIITVDNLKIAQFIYLLLNNKEIREVMDTITSKVVLILGRFTPERKAVLDAIRKALRQHNYLPILFDFEKPASRDITETISILAHLARFVIADITDAKSIPQELMLIVPTLPSVPVQPLILTSQHEYGMFEYFTRFPWVLPVYRYTDKGSLLQSIQEKVIAPAEQKAQELEKR